MPRLVDNLWVPDDLPIAKAETWENKGLEGEVLQNWLYPVTSHEVLQRLYEERRALALPIHVRPYSVLVAAMGNHWAPGCLEAAHAMAQYAQAQGSHVYLTEISDMCFYPFDGIGTMRNFAYMQALKEGYEYILYLDNDAKPPQDALWKLLRRYLPIVSPIIRYADGQSHDIYLAQLEANHGLVMAQSFVLSMVLFRMSVFLPWALTPFWENAIGAAEHHHFTRLAMFGHVPYVDTDVQIEVATPPGFPFDRLKALRDHERGLWDMAGRAFDEEQAKKGADSKEAKR